jgi:UDP:flavonoid glycosyltransferase YjiC (YdhE family)
VLGTSDGVTAGGPIVYVTGGVLGYVFRWLPIGRELRARGHRVVVVTTAPITAELAADEDFEPVLLSGEIAARAALEPLEASWPRPLRPVTRRIPGVALGPRGAARRSWAARGAVERDTDELLGALAGAALVVTEAEEHRTIRAAYGAGLPLLLIEDMYSTRPGPDVPFAARSHQAPTGSVASRFRAAAGWRRFFAEQAVRRRAEGWWVEGNDWHATMDALAVAAGMPEDAVERRYLQFFDYPTLPRIRTRAPELALAGEPTRPLDTGPVVDVARPTRGVDEAFAERWASVLQRRAAGDRVVYVSLGTFLVGFERLIATVVDAAAGIPRTQVVVSVGRDAERWEGRSLRPNVLVFGRVPQLEVLRNSDVVVTTGGLNTGHEALWCGVPMLVLPVGGIDAFGNAGRLRHHGLARCVPRRRITTGRIRSELELLLDDPGYRSRAAAASAVVRGWDGARRAADAIEAAALGDLPPLR